MELITDHALSVVYMKNLVDMEDNFIGELTNYTIALKEKINTIESFLKEVRIKREISKKNPEEFVSNPLNGYSLIRRLYEDWSYFELYLPIVAGASHLENIKNNLNTNTVLDMDMEDAAMGISSIEVYYDLEATDIARGFFRGKQYNGTLNTMECLVMANYATINGREQSSINWHEAAFQRYEQDEMEHGQELRQVFDFSLPQLFKKYTDSLMVKGFRRASIDLLRGVSDSDVRLWQLQRLLEKQIKAFGVDATYIKPPLQNFQRNCMDQSKTPNSKLKCFYEQKRTAFLAIAPLKTEILSLDPYIAIFHDVIYENEIRRVKNITLSSFKGPLRYSNRDEYNVQFAKVYEDQQSMLNKRIEDLTGDVVAKEDKDFDVYNYGIGGISYSHLDVPSEEDAEAGLGNYLTSIMFFLSDLEDGGALTFDNEGLTVPPKKGCALVWRNLDNFMTFDPRLFHSSCPVIMGSKWTLVKWLHEVPQIFARPCRNTYLEFNA
ncbi:uncharacterized protein Dana_GF23627 [Drosophila ananassae]|uniref:procollagen-proline 4-dioxygenase n=2 Tax=Drosophila ananassae TaxID=7217 RepID=B3M894_DROAN|nr:uncharacterized protein Dana_GF23627 [Drosophila ananassae]